MEQTDYLSINRQSWNNRTDSHIASEFYDMPSFLTGRNSLKEIELPLLGDVRGKSILHLQCHFGQDSISLQRMGAHVTGVDLSDKAISKAVELAHETGAPARFICADVYSLPDLLEEQFDIVFTSYGTIGWLPDIDRWASVVARFLKPGGRFVFAEFHPVVWMFDDAFQTIKYRYFNGEAIMENESGTYADPQAPIQQDYVSWNHGLAEVITSLLAQGLVLDVFQEFDYSPWNCFAGAVEQEPGRFRIPHLDNKIPIVYALCASRPYSEK